jgi:hypothetical protein
MNLIDYKNRILISQVLFHHILELSEAIFQVKRNHIEKNKSDPNHCNRMIAPKRY